jgi:solute carrier family 25 (mitochondrial folate transporter), member 32
MSATASTMTTDAPEPPPSPTTARERYAPTAARTPSRDLTAPDHQPSSFVSSFAVTCAKLPNSSVNAICGASAGIASGIVTCPLDVIKTRLQAQGSFRPRNHARPARTVYNGLYGTARVIWVEDGFRGMYRGLGPMLLGYIPTWAVYMSVYDYSKDYFYTRMGLSLPDHPPPVLTILQKINGCHVFLRPSQPVLAQRWQLTPYGLSRRA